MGASISRSVGSACSSSEPFLMMKRACSSVRRPSRKRCCLRKSRLGFSCASSRKSSSSVGFFHAGDCTSTRIYEHQLLGAGLGPWKPGTTAAQLGAKPALGSRDRLVGWCMQTFTDALRCADLGAVGHDMDGKVNGRDGLLLLDGSDGIVDLLGARLVGSGGGCAGAVLAVHVGMPG